MIGDSMEKNGWKLIGICGIYCGDCPSYLAHQTNDMEELKLRAQRTGFTLSSRMRRFLVLGVLKIISSITSFSIILNWAGFPVLKSFRRAGLSHGFWKSGSTEFLMKFKKALKRVNRNFFVLCLIPSDISDINAKMSSDVMDDSSMSPKWFCKLLRMNS